MATYPTDCKYTKEHEWAREEDGLVRVGITAYAVEQLGDVTLVDLPDPSTSIEAGAHFGDIESVKAVSELYAPISGEIVEVNTALESSPELINESPYGEGWMVLLKPTNPQELQGLLEPDVYEEFVSRAG